MIRISKGNIDIVIVGCGHRNLAAPKNRYTDSMVWYDQCFEDNDVGIRIIRRR